MPLLEEAYQKALNQGLFQIAMKAQTYLLRGWTEKGNSTAISKLKEEIFEFRISNSIPPTAQFYYTLGICACYEGKIEEAKYYFENSSLVAQSEDLSLQAQAELGLSIVDIERS